MASNKVVASVALRASAPDGALSVVAVRVMLTVAFAAVKPAVGRSAVRAVDDVFAEKVDR